MRRAAVVLAALALAGCGGGERRGDPAPSPSATPQGKLDEAERALRELEDSDLPADARRELEQAKELLEEGGRRR